jgi:transposase-like protein
MFEIEDRLGKPIDEALNESYQEHLSIRKVAKQMGVTSNTAHAWLRKLNVPMRRLLFPADGGSTTLKH